MKIKRNHHAIIIILLLVALLKIPNLLEPYWYGDEGIYLTLGLAVRNGLTLYKDIHDNKPPLLYLVAAVTQTQFWFKFSMLAFHLATLIALYRLALLLFPKSSRAAPVTSALFAVLVILFEGNIANGEIFMVLPIVCGMWLFWILHNSKKPPRHATLKYGFVGVCLALGFLFKVPAVFDFIGILSFVILLASKNIRETFRQLFSKKIMALIIGFLIPIAGSIAYYSLRGALAPYLYSALLQNVGYLGSWSTGSHESGGLLKSGLFLRGLVLIGSLFVVWIGSLRHKLSLEFRFMAAWFLFSLFGALLSGRPYPHYLIEPAAPFALLFVYFFYERKQAARIATMFVGSLSIISYLYIHFWFYPILPYYQNFLSWAAKRQSTDSYFAYFGNTKRTYELAKFIALNTDPKDRLFIWGDEPYIYALSNRLPAGRYTVAYHVTDFNGYEETIKAIEKERPKIIVIMDNETRPFPQLTALLSETYTKTYSVDGASMYKL